MTRTYGIGIDTGGTYTDAVVYDFETRQILSSSKALTTRDDLSRGILSALDALDPALVQRAGMVALSTTLATNACVEGKGGREAPLHRHRPENGGVGRRGGRADRAGKDLLP